MKCRGAAAMELTAPSPPAWGAWIEMAIGGVVNGLASSPPAWGAWIEIPEMAEVLKRYPVAPRMGGVD